jgi:hypothetical protein
MNTNRKMGRFVRTFIDGMHTTERVAGLRTVVVVAEDMGRQVPVEASIYSNESRSGRFLVTDNEETYQYFRTSCWEQR